MNEISSEMVRFEDVRKVFRDPKRGDVEALRGISFTCRAGEIVGLLGPNGAGKTTALRILSTVLAPTSGRAVVCGFDVAQQPLEVRRSIGFLTGSTALYPRLTCRETLTFFARLHHLPEEKIATRVEELLKAFDMLAYADGRVEKLSTGQKQKVSIARTVIHDPPLLILDEPTTGLDILGASAMIDFVSSRRSQGRCVLFSTHIMSEAEKLCDRIAIVHQGRLLAMGTLDELRQLSGAKYLEDVFRNLVQKKEHAAF